MKNDDTISKLIRNYCANNGMTLSAFAKKIKVPRRTVYSWSRAERVPTKTRFAKIIKVLDCPLSSEVTVRNTKWKYNTVLNINSLASDYVKFRSFDLKFSAQLFGLAVITVFNRIGITGIICDLEFINTERVVIKIPKPELYVTIKCDKEIMIGIVTHSDLRIDFVPLNTSILKELIKYIKSCLRNTTQH